MTTVKSFEKHELKLSVVKIIKSQKFSALIKMSDESSEPSSTEEEWLDEDVVDYMMKRQIFTRTPEILTKVQNKFDGLDLKVFKRK